jgi:hypothetical protein
MDQAGIGGRLVGWLSWFSVRCPQDLLQPGHARIGFPQGGKLIDMSPCPVIVPESLDDKPSHPAFHDAIRDINHVRSMPCDRRAARRAFLMGRGAAQS